MTSVAESRAQLLQAIQEKPRTVQELLDLEKEKGWFFGTKQIIGVAIDKVGIGQVRVDGKTQTFRAK